MLGHPHVEVMIVGLHIRKDRDEMRKVMRGDMDEQWRCRNAIIQVGTGHHDGQQQAQCLDHQMPLTPCDVLAAIFPARGTAHLGGLDRLALDTRGTGGGLAPCLHAGLFAQCPDQAVPCPSVTPLGNVVLDRTLGEHIMRQHIPLATAPMQGEYRVEDFPHVSLT